mmetsp:Transcript_20702/g.19734  ORF Transcript_20702/g.19734 Transcript_20702/m.19734 type:complete len:85 (+) Transcript_20702:89-343(+)
MLHHPVFLLFHLFLLLRLVLSLESLGEGECWSNFGLVLLGLGNVRLESALLLALLKLYIGCSPVLFELRIALRNLKKVLMNGGL